MQLKKVYLALAYLISFILCVSCTKRSRESAISVSPSDSEMNSAISHAKANLPLFWKAYDSRSHGESDFCVKARIKDGFGVEHFWLVDVARKGQSISGVVNNDPEIVHSVHIGQRIDVPEGEVSDWLYIQDGKMIGNYTARAILDRLPKAEQNELLSRLGEAP